MLKKIISAAVSVCFVCAGLVMPVSAAQKTVELTGWMQSCIDNENYDSEKTGIEITTDEGADGHCLHMFTAENGMAVRARQQINVEAGKKYRLSGKLKTNGSGYRGTMRFGDEGGSRMDFNNMDGYVSGEWFDFSKDFDYSYSSKLFTIYLQSDGNEKYFYADNLSIREVTTDEGGTETLGEELLVNGDFEMDFQAPDEAAFVQTAPANGVNYINVKSVLPVNIYQVTESGETKLDLGNSLLTIAKYGNLNVYAHSGLTNGEEYTYIVKTVSDSGNESDGVTVSATPSEIYDDYVTLSGWQYKNNNKNYGKVTIEPEIGIDGSGALKASNMTDSNANNTYLYIKNQHGFTLETGKTYQLSYWEKDGEHNELTNSMVIKVNNSQVSVDGGENFAEKNKNVSPPVLPTDGEWHKQIVYLKAEGENNTLEIQLNRHYEEMLLDNFELYEVDDQLNVISGAKNLMADGNCDFDDDFGAPKDAAFVQAAPANGVNYINVKTDLDVNIYQVTSNGETKLDLGDAVHKNAKYGNLKVFEHSGLENGEEYTYLVKTVSAYGAESEGVTVSATPLELYDDYVTLAGWQYRNNNKNYGKVTIEQGKGIDGSAALQASNMTDSSANSTYLYIKNQRGFILEPNKVYQLSYWEKDGEHNALSNSMVIKVNNSQVSVDGGENFAEKNKNVSPPVLPADGEWHKQIVYLKAEGENNTLEIQLNRHYEEMLLDNFELYEVDDQLNVVSGAVNLMANSNGDFENTSETGEISVDFRYYSAYSDGEHYGSIMDPAGISALSELADYDTNVVYAEAAVTNQKNRAGEPFSLIMAVYKDNCLYETQSMTAVATFGKKESFGFAYPIPSLDTGDYSIKMFIWDSVNGMQPIAQASEIKEK